MSNRKLLRLYSHSRLDTFRSCPRKFYYTYIRNWQSSGESIALTFGSSWHAAMDAVWAEASSIATDRKGVIERAYQAFIISWTAAGLPHPDELSPDDIDNYSPRTPMVAYEMLIEYIDARSHIFLDPTFELLDIERPFAVPLDPADDSLFYVGKLDKVFGYRGQCLIMEHKTSSAYRKGGPFRMDYLDSFSPNSQVDGYNYVGHKLCDEGAFGEKYKGKFAGVWVDAALVHASVHDGFKIIPVERRMEHLDQWLWTTMNWVDSIEGNRAVLTEQPVVDYPYLPAFPQNTTSCSGFSGCPMRDLCKAHANPAKIKDVPLGYVYKTHSLFDTIKLEKLGFTLEATEENK